MIGPVFVDTNVLVYFRDADELEKQKAAADWLDFLWARRLGRLSYQVLQEFYVTVTQKLDPGMSIEAARADVRSLLSWDPVCIDSAVVNRAWALQDGFQLSWWDSLIVACAQLSHCRYLLTEDLQEDQEFTGVTVVNPFVLRPTDI